MALTGLADPGLTVFPTHRLLSGFADDPERQATPRRGPARAVRRRGGRRRGARPARRRGGRRLRPLRLPPQPAYRLRLKDSAIEALDEQLAGKPEAYRRLDAAILETLVLKGIAGMSEDDILAKRGIGYSKSVADSLALLEDGTYDVAFILRPIPVDQVRAICESDENMPPKSTYFYPEGADRAGLQPGRLSRRRIRPWPRSTRKKGDDGTTSLWYGGRVPKHHGRTDAYGALDEACSALGVARASAAPARSELAADILRLQDDLFVAGAELATAPQAADRLEDGVSRTTEEMVDWIEERIDRYMDEVELPPKFVIPGGNRSPPSSTSPAP